MSLRHPVVGVHLFFGVGGSVPFFNWPGGDED